MHKTRNFSFLTGLILFFNCIVLVLLILNINNKYILEFDTAISKLFLKTRTPVLTFIFFSVSELGTWGTIIIVFVWGATRLIKNKNNELLFLVVFSLSGIQLVYLILKEIIKRPRPPFPHLIYYFGYSFPSGHSALAIVICGVIIYYIHKTECLSVLLSKAVFVLAFLLVILIGVSRIYLGVHFFTDVLGGYTSGFFWLVMFINFYNILLFQKNKPMSRSITCL